MEFNTPFGEQKYRAASGRAPYVHNRKRCGCGKVITARQLAQYGVCDRCWKGKQS